MAMTTTLSPVEALALGIPTLVLGVALLLFGYRVFRVAIVALGALVGAGLGAASPVAPLVAVIAGAIVGALLVWWFYKAGVFLVGALAGFFLLTAFAPAPTVGGLPEWALPLGAALLGGVLALLVERPAIIAATAFDGAYLSWAGGWAIAGAAPPDGIVGVVAVIALAVAGALAQVRVTARA